jgi:holo-[acyl-carrier protein] synthase
MRHITVTHDDLGKPILNTQGRLRDIIEEKGVGEAYLSLADEEEYAIAYVTFCLAAKNMK